MSEPKYDNAVGPYNAFGHTLDLLERHVPNGAEGVHLDLACGFGHIAEEVRSRFGLNYVGVDIDPEELREVAARGLEVHDVDLSTPGVLDRLRTVLDGRPLVSISMLDGLEHMPDGEPVLEAVATLVWEHRAIAVFSVPNVTHHDVAVKNLLGQWTYTPSGLLDSTHVQLFSETSLLHALSRVGLRRVDSFDVVLSHSDQYFPAEHVGLSEQTSIGSWLRWVRAGAEPNGQVNQFVWALTAVPPQGGSRFPTGPEASEVFLSILMRTQGTRPQELREALLSVAAQSCYDFEVIVLAHRTSSEDQWMVERIIADQVPSLRERISLVLVDFGGRATPLNVGLRKARGRYVTVLDDDDTVLAHWVSEFEAAAKRHPGRVLRGVALRQEVTRVTVRGTTGIKATDAPRADYSPTFSMPRHLAQNDSPAHCWAYPRSLHSDFGMEYDESMTTTEDWEYLLRAVQVAGVASIPRTVAIYRWFDSAASSRTDHDDDEWYQNHVEVARRIDNFPVLLPAGASRQIRDELLKKDENERYIKHLLGELRGLQRRNRRQERRIKNLDERVEDASGASIGGREAARILVGRFASKSRTAVRNPRLVGSRVKSLVTGRAR